MGAMPNGLSANRRFAPPEGAGSAEPFVGTLHLEGARMILQTDDPQGVANPMLGKDTAYFPGVSLAFFTHDGRLVPTHQGVVRNGVLANTRSYWDLIAQPGRVWVEAEDDGWNRASFPFALVNSIENETHTGIALFLYKGSQVSYVRFQIVQQTSPWYVTQYFVAWGVTGARYENAGAQSLDELRSAYALELSRRLPVRSWSVLEKEVAANPLVTAAITLPGEEGDSYVAALVRDGVLYRTPCHTAAGPFPYCNDMRHGVWSVTKSAMINVALLRLAQRFGRSLLEESVADFLPSAPPGWKQVSFLDLANMASGHGWSGDEGSLDYNRWSESLPAHLKTVEALADPLVREPGSEFHYRDSDAYLLGVALGAYLKVCEGPDASIWEMLEREVYRPIGIFHAPSNSTVEADGSRGLPLMAFGYYPTLDDLAKIALLYQNHGAWEGRQILHRELVDGLLPTSTEPRWARSPSPGYYMNWWISSSGGWWISNMEGYGGNTVALLPGGLVAIDIARANEGGCTGCGDGTVRRSKQGMRTTNE